MLQISYYTVVCVHMLIVKPGLWTELVDGIMDKYLQS